MHTKGNLGKRIAKLGSEKEAAELSPFQIILRRTAEQQTQPWWTVSRTYDRPDWANGAFVYLLPRHARLIEHAIRTAEINCGARLNSRHVVVSGGGESGNPWFMPLKDLVTEQLRWVPPGTGREVFIMRKTGQIEYEDKIFL